MNDTPLASIGLLCYNQESYIKEALASLVAQRTSFSFEILVGDDNSTDNTRQIVEQYKDKYPDLIRLMPKVPNKGLLRNYIDTLKNCRGKYIAFCAGDDYWHDPLKLEKEVKFLEENPDYGLIHTDVNHFYEREGVLLENKKTKAKARIPEGYVFESLLTRSFSISALTACYVKKYVDQYVDFDEFLKEGFVYEDYPTWVELSRHTKFKYLAESTATYRVVFGSISRPAELKRKYQFLDERLKITRYFIKKYNVKQEIAQKVENKYYLEKFNISYRYKDRNTVIECFRFLKDHGAATPKLYIKSRLVNYPWLLKLSNSLLALIKSRESLVRAS